MSDDSEEKLPSNEAVEKTMRPAEQAAKTMRPDNQVEKTMRPGSQTEKTMRPQGEQTAKTMRPDAQTEKTMRPDGASRSQSQQGEIDRVINQDETEFVLGKGVKYQVVKVISKSSGEADIYLIEYKGQQFALKLYRDGIRPVEEVLKIIHNNANTGFLVDILEYGIWTNPNNPQEKRDYELMPYFGGGSLDQLKIPHNAQGEKLLCEIAIRCAIALDILHKKRIIHRDVKPANFFFKSKEQKIDDMALADFGIGIICDKDGFAEFKSQLRTPIYPAPEYYDSAQNEKGETIYQIDTKSDFFALGMSLLTLWSGEDQFKGGELQLKNKKKFGNLPYPTDVSDHTLQLLKALTHPNFEKRAGIKEIEIWKEGKKDIYDLRQGKEDIGLFKVVYNSAKNQVAKSKEELGSFMYNDKDLATKYLYSGTVEEWLKTNENPESRVVIQEIVEKRYPKDQEAGFFAACYFLNPNLPYTDVKGNQLTDNQDIVQTLQKNFKHYQKALANPNDSLFLFFNATNNADITKEFAPKFKKDNDKENRDALLQMIYTLDEDLPWIMTTKKKATIECFVPEDVIKARYENTLSDESWSDLLSDALLVWLHNVNPAIERKVRSAKGRKERQSAVLYNLSPMVSYTYQLDKQAGDYFLTCKEVAEFMNINVEKYILDENNSAAAYEINMMFDIDDTELYDYLKSKGVYNEQIKWIKYCSNVKSKDNVNKAGPYNEGIGLYKSIKGLGFDPYYYFPQSDKRVYSLEEFEQIPSNEREQEFKKGSYLQDWLTLFFQENNDLDLSEKFTYEKETIKFVEYLEKLDPTNIDVVNYKIGTDKVEDNLRYLKRRHTTLRWSKIIVGVITLIASIAVIFGLLSMHLPLIDAKTQTGWIYLVAIIAGIVGFGLMFLISDLGCLGNLIVGAVVAVAFYFILYFLIPYIAYITIGILVLTLVLWFIKSYIQYPMIDKAAKSNGVDHQLLLNPSFEERCVEPLFFTFSDDQNFKSSIGTQSYNYAYYLSDGTKRFYKQLIFPWILIFLLGFAIVKLPPLLEKFNKELADQNSKYESLVGNWKGTFDNTPATLEITEANKNEMLATISVNYKKPLTENLKGGLNLETKSFHFNDLNPNNGILDGRYSGDFTDDFTSFSGTYQNSQTRKQVKFSFKKAASVDATQQTTQPKTTTKQASKVETAPSQTETSVNQEGGTTNTSVEETNKEEPKNPSNEPQPEK